MSARALANQERQLQMQRMSKLGRSALLLLATILSFSTIGLLIADQLYRPQAFVIDQLKIKGKFRYLDPSQVEQVIKRGDLGNFFSIDLVDVKRRIESVAWVDQADVRREWPNTLLIDVSEHRPVLPFNRNDIESDVETQYWLTSKGQVVDLPGEIGVQNPINLFGKPRDSKLMLTQTYQWKKLIESHGLKLTDVTLSDSHSWKLRLSYLTHEFDVLLGRVDVGQRLSRFLFLFESQFRQSDQRLNHVDARYPNGLAIKSQPIEGQDQVAMATLSTTASTIKPHNQ